MDMETKKLSLSGSSGIVSKYSYIVVFLIIFAVYAATSSSLTWSGVMNIFRHSAIIGIIALGMGLICLTGEIDLSVGSMLAMVSGFSVVIYNITGSIFAAFLFAVAFGGFCGLINGILVGGAEMPAFIVTLATMLIFPVCLSETSQGAYRRRKLHLQAFYPEKLFSGLLPDWKRQGCHPSLCGADSGAYDRFVCISFHQYEIWEKSLCHRKQPEGCGDDRDQCACHKDFRVCHCGNAGGPGSFFVDCHERLGRSGHYGNQL